MPPFRISAHALSYSILMAPALVYTAYSYRNGVGEDNTELEDKLVSGTQAREEWEEGVERGRRGANE